MTDAEIMARIASAFANCAREVATVIVEARRDKQPRRRATFAPPCKESPSHADRADAEIARLKL